MCDNETLGLVSRDVLFSVCFRIVLASFEPGRPSRISSHQDNDESIAMPCLLNRRHPNLETAKNLTRHTAMIHLEWPGPIILRIIHKLECKVAHQRSDETLDFRTREPFSDTPSRALAKGHERTSVRCTTESGIRRPPVRVKLLRVGRPQFRRLVEETERYDQLRSLRYVLAADHCVLAALSPDVGDRRVQAVNFVAETSQVLQALEIANRTPIGIGACIVVFAQFFAQTVLHFRPKAKFVYRSYHSVVYRLVASTQKGHTLRDEGFDVCQVAVCHKTADDVAVILAQMRAVKTLFLLHRAVFPLLNRVPCIFPDDGHRFLELLITLQWKDISTLR